MSSWRRAGIILIILIQILFFYILIFHRDILALPGSIFHDVGYEEWKMIIQQGQEMSEKCGDLLVLVGYFNTISTIVLLGLCIKIVLKTKNRKKCKRRLTAFLLIAGICYTAIFIWCKYFVHLYYLYMELLPAEVTSILLTVIIIIERGVNKQKQ